MERIRNKKGFTLAELLIVVAIIAVLVAIAIPVFTSQLEKSREATDKANLRSAYAEQMTAILTWDGTEEGQAEDITVHPKQTQAKWQSDGDEEDTIIADGIDGAGVTVTAKTAGTDWTVTVDYTGTEPVVEIK